MTPAGLPIRIAARAIDVVVIVLLDVALGLLIGFGWDFLIIGTVMVLAYFALLDAFVGGTLGKLVLGLRVVGDPPPPPRVGSRSGAVQAWRFSYDG